MRRRLARRTAGSAGRSAGASLEWKNMPIATQSTSSCMIEDVRVTVRLFAGLRQRAGVRLEYEAFEEMAEPMLRRLAGELTEKHGLCKVAIHHRVGAVDIGEASVVIAVSAPHRAAALDACREAIDTLKETIPLWKKEIYAGGEEWIGRGS